MAAFTTHKWQGNLILRVLVLSKKKLSLPFFLYQIYIIFIGTQIFLSDWILIGSTNLVRAKMRSTWALARLSTYLQT